MRYIIVAICILAALLFAFLVNSWLRSHRGQSVKAARVYAVIRERNRNFRAFHYAPVIITFAAAAAAAGLTSGWRQSAACAAGAAAVLIPVLAGSGSYASGITASFSGAASGDIRQSIRSGYRTGALLGSLITGVCLAVLLALFYLVRSANVVNYAPSFMLGAAVTSGILHTGGEVYSSAYSLAVSSRDFTDMSGIYIGRGADFAGTYAVSLCAAVLLSDVAVDTSGVTSTFTADAAAFFPLIVYATGIAGSVIGAFLQRSGLGADPSRGGGIGCLAAGILTVICSVYFSVDMLQSRVYAWAVASGVAAGLAISEFSRGFSSDSRIYINSYKTDRGLGRHSSVIFNLGTGMMATSVYTIILIAGIAVSYMFASYYGVALFAVGICSMTGSAAAVSGISVVTGSASDIISSADDQDVTASVTSALDRSAVRNSVYSRTYAAAAGSASAFALLCAFYYMAGGITVDAMSLRVFFGILTGTAAAFFFTGILITSVKVTGRIALIDLGRNEDETGATSALRGTVVPVAAILLPVVIGLFAGVQALAGFIVAVSAAGCIITLALDSSGMHYENTSVQSLTSLIRMMSVVSIAFVTVFLDFGGFLFR